MHVVFDGVSALDAHESGQFVFTVGALDVGDGKSHHHAVGMMCRLLVNRVDQIESVLHKMALIGHGVDPDGEKLRPEIAATSLVEAEVTHIVRIGRADIEAFVEKSLRRVGMSVYDDDGLVNRAGASTDSRARWIGGLSIA